MEGLKVDLEQGEVYVFTPKGQVIALVKGATPIDFAYAVHTEVGHACVGARINGRLVSLNHELVSGDTCEIFTSKVEGTGPSRDWLQLVRTPRAANKIRQWFSRERREDAKETGRDDLDKQLRREGLPVQKLPANLLAEVATSLNYVDVDALHTAVGEHHVSAESVAAKVAKLLRSGDPEREEQLPTTINTPRRSPSTRLGCRRPRRRPRRPHGPPVAVLHAGARRRDHGLRHQRPWRVGPPRRLRQRGVAAVGAGRPVDRRGVGREPGRRGVRRVHRGPRPRPASAPHATSRARSPITTSTSCRAT